PAGSPGCNSTRDPKSLIPSYRSTQPITDFDDLQFDYRDRLSDIHLVTIGFTNTLIQKRVHDKESEYQQVVRHSLTQSYDFYSLASPETDPSGTYAVKKFPWSE